MHTQIPVPRVLAWDADPLNPVGAEYNDEKGPWYTAIQGMGRDD
jgi:hypothetical protein